VFELRYHIKLTPVRPPYHLGPIHTVAMQHQRFRHPAEPSEYDDHTKWTPEEIEAPMTMEEIRLLKAQNIELMADLEEATSAAFSGSRYAFSGSRYQYEEASSVSIRDEYMDLCSAVDAWALKTTVDFPKADLNRMCEGALARERSNHGVPHGRWSISNAVSSDKLSKSDNFGCFMLSRQIMRWLFAYVFKHRFPVGATKEQQDLLDTIEDGMRSPSVNAGTCKSRNK